jgi:hypothetical protein
MNMQSTKLLAASAAFALLFSIPVFAKASHNDAGSFDLTQRARVGSTMLPPGHYKAEWVGPNQDVNVSIVRRGKVVATTKGQVKELPKPAPYNAVTVKNTTNHTQRVEEIDFNNRRDALVLSGALSS